MPSRIRETTIHLQSVTSAKQDSSTCLGQEDVVKEEKNEDPTVLSEGVDESREKKPKPEKREEEERAWRE